MGYNPWGQKELDTTEQLTLSHFQTHLSTNWKITSGEKSEHLCTAGGAMKWYSYFAREYASSSKNQT